jgi:hypothetical protein
LKLALIGLGLTVVVEVTAAYLPAALTDILTIVFGAMLMRRDLAGLMQGLPAFTAIAGFNFLFQALTLVQFLLVFPGFEHFLSDNCPTHVKKHDADGHESSELKNLCSWRTIMGNVALSVGVLLEFACVRLSWKMVKSMRDATVSIAFPSATMPMMDVEGGLSQLAPHLAAPRQQRQPGLAQAQAGPAGLPGPVAGQAGFAPFSGAPHRLGDD